MPAVPDLKAGDLLAGKYTFERVLGVGGMGVVVAAWHAELEQRVAIKYLNEIALKNKTVALRFDREARAAVKIKSRHVARVSDVGKLENGSPYMVMEFLEGRDLHDVMDKEGPQPIVRAVDYVLQACEAISEAHAYGIVHRDLKPANLYLAEQGDGSIEVKVLDFGISKSLTDAEDADHALTKTTDVFGSPMYMSPEQLTSTANVDPRTDIWSLGIILYELLSGNPPFFTGSVAEIWSGILDKTIPPLGSRRAGLPAELEAAVMRCLRRPKEERFAFIADFAQAIAPFGTGTFDSCVERAKRFKRGVRTSSHGQMAPAPSPSSPGTPKPRALELLFDPAIIAPSVLATTAAADNPELPKTPLPRTSRSSTPSVGLTSTDWQAPGTESSRAPWLILAFGVILGVAGSAFILRSRVAEVLDGTSHTAARAEATARASASPPKTVETVSVAPLESASETAAMPAEPASLAPSARPSAAPPPSVSAVPAPIPKPAPVVPTAAPAPSTPAPAPTRKPPAPDPMSTPD